MKHPNLRDPNKIGHKFTRETLKEVKISDKDFLSSVEKECFEEMLVKHGKTFDFELHEIGCVDPSVIAPMVILILHYPACALEPTANSCTKSSLTKANGIAKRKDQDGNPRAFMCSILQQMVHCAKEKRSITLHSRYATYEQGHNQERQNRTDCGMSLQKHLQGNLYTLW